MTPPQCPIDTSAAWSHGVSGGWPTVLTSPTGTTWTDATATADPNATGSPWGTCYQYRIVVIDRVGNGVTARPVGAPAPSTVVAQPGVLVTRPACTTVNEDGAATCSLRVRLATAPAVDATITLDGGSQLRFDGGLQSRALTFTTVDWWVDQEVIVEAYDDAIQEMNPHPGTVTLTATSSDPAYDGFPIPAEQYDVVDDDQAGIRIRALGSPANVTDVTEGGATDTIEVVLTSEPTGPVTVSGVVGNGTSPTGSSDARFLLPLVFTPTTWMTPQVAVIEAIDDNYDEPDPEYNSISWAVTTTDPFYAAAVPDTGPGTTQVTIHDNDTAAFVINGGPTYTVTEGGAAQTFTIRLATVPSGPVTLDLALRTGQAAATPMQLVFNASNWNVPQTVTITAVDDAIDEPDGDTDHLSIAVTSSDPAYGGTIIPGYGVADTANITVNDNDTVGVVSTSSTPERATENGDDASWTIRLASQPLCPVQVDLSLLVGQATVITPSSGVLVFTPLDWNVAQEIVVRAIDDPIAEGVHADTLRYALSTGGCDPGYDALGVPDVPIEITDNEVAGVVLTKTSLVVDEGGRTDSYQVRLTSQPAGDVIMVIRGDDDVLPSSPGRDEDGASGTVTLRFTPLDWDQWVTITATAVDDLIAEGTPHVGTITATVSSAIDPAYNSNAPTNPINVPPVNVSINDNDEPGIEVQHTNGSTNVSEDGATDTYLVRLKSPPQTVVNIRTIPDEQVRSSPQTLTFDSSNWNVWQAVTVTAVDDARVEGEHKGYVRHVAESTDPFYHLMKGATLEVDITDNDAAGVIATTTTGGALVVKEGKPGVCDYLTVRLAAQPTANVTVRLFPDPEPEVTVSPGRGLVFSPQDWNKPQRFIVCAVDDDQAEGTEILQLKLRSFSDDRFYNGRTWPDVTVRVEDNDAAVITRHEPLDARNITVTRNDRLTGRFTVKLFDRPTAPVRVYIRYPRDLTGTVVNTRTSRRKFLTFTSRNWHKPQSVRVWYKPGSGGRGTVMRSINFRVQSKDRRYNNIRAKIVRVRVMDNNRVGTRWRSGPQPGTLAGDAAGRPSPAPGSPMPTTKAPAVKAPPTVVTAPLPTSVAPVVAALLPAEAAAHWDPAQVTGRRFDAAAITAADGAAIEGGVIRIGSVAPGSEQGFETVARAARHVRTIRARDAATWTDRTRYVVLLGSDRRYYVYDGRLAADAANLVPEQQLGSVTALLFGTTWAAWRDEQGTWRAAPDTAGG
jgi:hypothetical protein